MKRFTTAASILALSSTAAFAGAIDRSGQFLGPLFQDGGETGQYAEFSFGMIDPQAGAAPIPVDPLQGYTTFGLAYKTQLNDQLSFALFLFDVCVRIRQLRVWTHGLRKLLELLISSSELPILLTNKIGLISTDFRSLSRLFGVLPKLLS